MKCISVQVLMEPSVSVCVSCTDVELRFLLLTALCALLKSALSISQVSPQAAGYVVKYVVDSNITDGATSSGPHGISLSTTMDDDVFIESAIREVEVKTPDSQDDLSERSVVKISPGSVRQEVSQAIIDKKGTLIILKEVEDKEDSEGKENDGVIEEERTEAEQKEEDVAPAIKEDAPCVIDATVVKTSVKMEIKTDDTNHIKVCDSPKKASAPWISEVAKPAEGSEIICVSAKEVKEMKMSDGLHEKAEIFTFEEVRTERSKSGLTTTTEITITESSATSLAVVLYENKNQQLLLDYLPPHLHSHSPHCFPPPAVAKPV